MAVVNSISWLFYILLLVVHGVSKTNRKNDLKLITWYRELVEKTLAKSPCTEDYNLLSSDNIFHDYSFWDNETRTTNNVANYITSMWRYKDASSNWSLVENVATMYMLAKSIALSSQSVYGAAVCFDEFKFRGRQRFCPYAFKNRTEANRTVIRDLGRYTYTATPPTPPPKENPKHSFIWWHVGKKYLANGTALEKNTIYLDRNLDNPASDSLNVSTNVQYNVTSSFFPRTRGKWTTPYYDCFGGQTWMITYLAPFYDEAKNFLGCVKFDIELDSIDIDECDAPQTEKPREEDKREEVEFYGQHACRNKTTMCVHVHGGGFTAGNYRCICRKGYYFPIPNAKKKYFNGRDVQKAKEGRTNYSLYDCLPCREGCEECVDDTPCMYQRNMSLRTVFLAINEIIKAFAIALGVFIFIFRERKIIKASSPVFMEIIAFGVVLMYFEITLGYFEDSVLLCILRSWLYHTGFILAFGSLLLKTWRIAVIFRLRTAKMIELTDRTLVKYLMLMLLAVACYLMIWTWTHTREYEIETTSAGYKYRRCVREWFSNAIEIGEVLLLLWGVWLCLRVRNAPSAYNESKYIAWCIYNTVFIMTLVGLLRIVLDNFHNPDVSYVVDFLSTHVVATVMLVLLFLSKVSLLRKYKDTHRNHRRNSTTSTAVTDLRKSPFHLNRLVDGSLVCETEEDKAALGLETENIALREEIRNLNAKLAIFENKLAREYKRKGSGPEEDFKMNSDFHANSPDSETESSRDANGFSGKRRRKRSAAADSTTSNGSVFGQEEKTGSLIEDIKNAEKHEHFLAVPKQSSVSDEETFTVMSNISNGST